MDSQLPNIHIEHFLSASSSLERIFLLIILLFITFIVINLNGMAYAEDTGLAVLVGDEIQSDGSILIRGQRENGPEKVTLENGVWQAGDHKNNNNEVYIVQNNSPKMNIGTSRPRQRERIEKKMTWEDG